MPCSHQGDKNMQTIYCLPENFIKPRIFPGQDKQDEIRVQAIKMDELFSGKLKFPLHAAFIFNLDKIKLENYTFWTNYRKYFPYGASLGITSEKIADDHVQLCSLFGIDEVINIDSDIDKTLCHLCEKVQFIAQVKKVHYDLTKKLKMRFIVGKTHTIRELVSRIPVYANSNSTIMILGETGTGKELFARAFHYLGRRAGKPFITVDCSTLPESLAENELFGHVKGSYTHAQNSQRGLLAEADEGTVFFDEIESLPYHIQSKLLRFIQEREYKPVGGNRYTKVDVRLITASNEDLARLVKEGKFRRDLFHRLNVAPIHLPALRDRREDIPILSDFFLRKFSNNQINFDSLPQNIINKWLEYSWPGNIRELENRVQQFLLKSPENPVSYLPVQEKEHDPEDQGASFEPLHEYRSRILARYESSYLRALLKHTRGNISQAARIACMNRKNLSLLLKKYGIR